MKALKIKLVNESKERTLKHCKQVNKIMNIEIICFTFKKKYKIK